MLLEALESRLDRRRQASIVTVPFPIGGWNTRDKLEETPQYAPIMTNIRPQAGKGVMRGGYEAHATGLPSSNVETLMNYHAGTTEKLFAAVGTEIYDVTSSGAVGAADVTSLTNARFQWVMHATSGGNFLAAVNGADGVRTYSGSAWASQTITGVTAANLIDVVSHKHRLWFIEMNSLSLWYLGTYAISGAAAELDLGALCSHGGFLQAVATWSLDSGNGPDDYLVAITSEGEVVIYAGTDPSSIDTFYVVGVYKIDKPLGRRCTAKHGADLAVLTQSGVILLSEILSVTAQKNQFSDPIRDDFIEAAIEAETNFGWELFLYGRRGELIANIPRSTGNLEQFINVKLNRAWWRSTGQSAKCWGELSSDLYFGSDSGGVYKADTGMDDNGSGITIDFQYSWSRFKTSRIKQATMFRTNIFTDGDVSLLGAIKADYDDSAVTASVTTISAIEGSTWDADAWDVAVWGGGLKQAGRWASAEAEGTVLAPRLRLTTTTAQIQIGPTDIAYMIGEFL